MTSNTTLRDMPAYESAHNDLGFVTFRVAGQWFGLPVTCVQEVLTAQRVARVPLAPRDVIGFLNLRGQIVTVIDVRTRMGFPSDTSDPDATHINVVIRDDTEFFSLRVDEIGDVVNVPASAVEPLPVTLGACWSDVCVGVVYRARDLVVILDAGRLVCDPVLL
jgi:purine-binding chemotaxis protein CheW